MGTKMDFWEIYDQYYPKVKRFISATVKDEWIAEDLVQETFTRAQTGLKDLKDPSKLSAWIFRIAHNLCQDHFRDTKRRSDKEREVAEQATPKEEASVQDTLESHQMGQCVRDMTEFLPQSHRTVLILFDVMELTHAEISEVLGITVQNVKVRLHRARRKLKEILEENCNFEVDGRNVLTCEPKMGRPKCAC
jgi:RNA polymerase sigma-70 factor (ECF subfamily)